MPPPPLQKEMQGEEKEKMGVMRRETKNKTKN
jgi:hypothetical protein